MQRTPTNSSWRCPFTDFDLNSTMFICPLRNVRVIVVLESMQECSPACAGLDPAFAE